jgi:hypothetical protein
VDIRLCFEKGDPAPTFIFVYATAPLHFYFNSSTPQALFIPNATILIPGSKGVGGTVLHKYSSGTGLAMCLGNKGGDTYEDRNSESLQPFYMH